MRAQLSLEYLLISVVALALLAISVASLSQIRDYAEESGRMLRFRQSAGSLAEAASSVCALGSGNRRSLWMDQAVDVDWQDGLIRISGEGSIARAMPCETDPKTIQGQVEIKNEDGELRIRQR